MQTLQKHITAISMAAILGIIAISSVEAQPAPDLFQMADANKDGQISREELKGAMNKWLGGRDQINQEQLTAALNDAIPEPVFMAMISPPQNRTPKADDVQKMMAALPSSAPGKTSKQRKVLVLNKCGGFVHACIPLAAKTIEELGAKTKAWTATVSYDADVITAENLKQYDLLFLNNTTGNFLDDVDPKVTAARKKALLDFVRSGKGLAGIHAASDSYHRSTDGPAFGGTMATGIISAADKNADKAIDAQELETLSGSWFDRVDEAKSGTVTMQAFKAAFPRIIFSMRAPRGGRGPGGGAPAGPPAGKPGPDRHIGTWPEFNKLIGGFFKYHWLDPQHIVYKIDDPASPLTAMFRGGFEVNDETYTFGMNTWSRENLRILASVDYSKMSDADKAKEDFPRTDHDYGLSWIRREGKGRVFYTAHGHNERVYANKAMLEHLLAGIQYALGDLKADDSPSVKRK